MELEGWMYVPAAIAFLLIGVAIGAAVSDYFATHYWNRALELARNAHKRELAEEEIASFNKGVLAALKSETDKDIPND